MSSLTKPSCVLSLLVPSRSTPTHGKTCTGTATAGCTATRVGGFSWSGNGFDAWMYGIARNVVLETQRGATLSRKLWDRGNNEVQAVRPAPHADLSDVVADQHDRAVVMEAFDRLSADDQEILELRVVGRMSAEAVGGVIGKKPGAVRMAQSRAVDRLRQSVEDIDHG